MSKRRLNMNREIRRLRRINPAAVPDRPNRPDVETNGELILVENAEATEAFKRGGLSEFGLPAGVYCKCYNLGECTVIVTREFGKWHLSIAHRARYPTWGEISAAWYRAIPGAGETVVGAMILPKIGDYINIHRFCMQVLEIDDPDRKVEEEHGKDAQEAVVGPGVVLGVGAAGESGGSAVAAEHGVHEGGTEQYPTGPLNPVRSFVYSGSLFGLQPGRRTP